MGVSKPDSRFGSDSASLIYSSCFLFMSCFLLVSYSSFQIGLTAGHWAQYRCFFISENVDATDWSEGRLCRVGKFLF